RVSEWRASKPVRRPWSSCAGQMFSPVVAIRSGVVKSRPVATTWAAAVSAPASASATLSPRWTAATRGTAEAGPPGAWPGRVTLTVRISDLDLEGREDLAGGLGPVERVEVQPRCAAVEQRLAELAGDPDALGAQRDGVVLQRQDPVQGLLRHLPAREPDHG